MSFFGECKNTKFAFTHNGVISNDKALRVKFSLPKTKVATDSFIAVQLLESQKRLDFESIKYMAEQTEGSFSYSILDSDNNIWLVKGDSPLSIVHFPKLKIYVYASTEEILCKSLIDYAPLFKELKNGDFEKIDISEGEILKIRPDGMIERNEFVYSYYFGRDWWGYGSFSHISSGSTKCGYTKNDYIEDLKSIATFQGYSPDDIDELIASGFTLEEIEDYIYCCGEM